MVREGPGSHHLIVRITLSISLCFINVLMLLSRSVLRPFPWRDCTLNNKSIDTTGGWGRRLDKIEEMEERQTGEMGWCVWRRYLGHPVVDLHGLDPLAEALSCRGGLGHYAGVKVRVGHVLAADLLHDGDLMQRERERETK